MIRLNPNSSGTSRHYRTNLKSHNGFPHCTALIDVLFLLLLFIAIASQAVRISGIRVDLPKVDAPQETVLGKLIVTVTPADYDGDCRIFFRDRQVTLDELRQQLSLQSDSRNSKTVVIRADNRVPGGVLYELVSAAHEAGMPALIAVQSPDARPEMRFE